MAGIEPALSVGARLGPAFSLANKFTTFNLKFERLPPGTHGKVDSLHVQLN
jgi:hypothetical protein